MSSTLAVILETSAEPRDDLLYALLNAEQDGNRLSETELYAMMVWLIVAGHETTVNLIGNAMLALFSHPEQMAELHEHPELMPKAIEEFLRYDGPVERAFVRFATEDVRVNGHKIKKGGHYCLGAPLARLEGEIALNNLLQALPNLALVVPAASLHYRMLPTFRSLESLPVRWAN